MAEMSFIFGKGQKARTPEEARRLREFAEALMGSQRAPQNVGEGLMALANGLSARFAYNAASKASADGRAGAESKVAPIFSALFGRNSPVPGVTPTGSKVAAALDGNKSDGAGNLPSRFDFANAEKAGKGNGTTYASFMGEVGKDLTNPYGLAAVAATGKAESSWSPTNVAGTWNDPSQSGKAGTAGGAMSWRNERLAGLQEFARKNGLDPTDPTTQAKFFMQEDPQLVAGLQNARSVEEAQGLINNAWKFAGYDQLGGESARRLAYAKEYLPSFQGGTGTDTMVGSAGNDRMAPAGGFDWSQYAVEGATRPDSFSGMQPEFSGSLEQLFASAPPEIREQLRVGSGYRSPERQAELYQDALKKYGSAEKARKWVAPPGNSQHNHGAAADLKYLSKEAREWVRANAGRFGLAFPLGNEPWHIELASARGGSGAGAPLLAGRGGTDQMLGSAGSDALTTQQTPRVPPNIAASRFDGPGSLGDPGVQAALAAQRGQQPREQGPGPLQAISRAFGFGGQPQPQEVAQAAPQTPSQGFPPQPPAPTAGDAGSNGALSMENLYRVLQDPWVDEGTKRVVMSEIQRQQQMQDPMYQLELEKSQAELRALQNPKPGEEWAKLDENRLFNQRTGEIRSLPGGPGGGAFRFQGNSVEAQALNGLMDGGALTPDQAQQLAAGKTVSGPNGELMFLTPQGVFGQQAGQPPLPITPQGAPGPAAMPPPVPAPAAPPPAAPIPNAAPPAVAPQPQPGPPPAPPLAPPQQSGQRPGMIPLTSGKPEKPTEAQRNRLSNVGQAKEALINELDRYQQLVEKNGIEALPGEAKDNLNTVRQGIMLQMKELFNLGVLNGPDLSLMERMIYDPVVDPFKEGGLSNMLDQTWTGIFGGAGERAKNSVTELKRMIGSINDSVGNNMPNQPGASAGNGTDGWTSIGNAKLRVKPQ